MSWDSLRLITFYLLGREYYFLTRPFEPDLLFLDPELRWEVPEAC